VKVHDAVARTIADHGVRTLFGLMGDANMLYITDFISQHQGRFVPAVDERNSVLMAGGYAAAGDVVGVATVTHGPALTNAITSLVEVTRGRLPVVLITGDTPADRDHLQRIDIQEVARLAGSGYEKVWVAETAARDTARAFQRAAADCRPVILDVPYDLLECDAGDYRFGGLAVSPQRTQADPDVLDDALGLAVNASRPVVLAGRGAVRAGARDALLELSGYLGAPVATSLLAKDYFPGAPPEPRCLRRPVHPGGVRPTCRGRLRAGLRREPEPVHRRSRRAPSGRPGRAGGLRSRRLRKLHAGRSADRGRRARGRRADALEPQGGGYEPADRQTVGLARELREWSPSSDFKDQSSADTVDLRAAMITLDQVVPERRNLVADGGRFVMTPWRYVHVDDPLGFVHSVNFGSIGLGLGTAIGVAAARPDRVTVVVLGDGGFMQGMTELRTAVNERLPLIMVIANDGAYGAEWRKLKSYGLDPGFSRTNWCDLAGLAEACGARGYTVRTVEDLEKLKPVFADLTGPVLVDVRIDPAIEFDL
jgi:thiamine pyrophosphate-dependent acetolactate synthase large subunit-like protein